MLMMTIKAEEKLRKASIFVCIGKSLDPHGIVAYAPSVNIVQYCIVERFDNKNVTYKATVGLNSVML